MVKMPGGYPTDVALTEESALVMEVNPFLYNVYFYDEDTSRYYDPEIGRWINAYDIGYLDPGSVASLNLYVYCNDNPIKFTDLSGCFVIASFLIGASIATLIGAEVGAATYWHGSIRRISGKTIAKTRA
jgi:RHS repeat-associated protein